MKKTHMRLNFLGAKPNHKTEMTENIGIHNAGDISEIEDNKDNENWAESKYFDNNSPHDNLNNLHDKGPVASSVNENKTMKKLPIFGKIGAKLIGRVLEISDYEIKFNYWHFSKLMFYHLLFY